MKRRFFASLLCAMLCATLFTSVAHADMGPKPSVRITLEGLDGRLCYGTLLSEETETGPARVWRGDPAKANHKGNDPSAMLDKDIWQAFVDCAAADTDGRLPANSVDLDPAVCRPYFVNGAGDTAAAAADESALKSGAGGGRGHIKHTVFPQGDFTVGADITQQSGFVAAHIAGQHSAGDVCTHKGIHAGWQIGGYSQKGSVRIE